MGYENQDSILATIKKMLGIDDNYSVFDMDIIVLINAALMNLHQLDVGPKDGFVVTDYQQTWKQFLTNKVKLEAAKTYVYLKVKTTFDPPSSSFVLEAYNKQIQELECRLIMQAESVEEFDFIPVKPEPKPDPEPTPGQTNVNVIVEGENMTIVRDPDPSGSTIIVEQSQPVGLTLEQQFGSSSVPGYSSLRNARGIQNESETSMPKPEHVPEPPANGSNYAVHGENLQLFTAGLFG